MRWQVEGRGRGIGGAGWVVGRASGVVWSKVVVLENHFGRVESLVVQCRNIGGEWMWMGMCC